MQSFSFSRASLTYWKRSQSELVITPYWAYRAGTFAPPSGCDSRQQTSRGQANVDNLPLSFRKGYRQAYFSSTMSVDISPSIFDWPQKDSPWALAVLRPSHIVESILHVAILGGGIAGLATAITLKQVGMTVSVFEQRKSVHNLGAGVVCWPNASFVLSELGILDQLRAVAGAVVSMRRISKDGINLGSLDIRRLDSAMGYPSLSVLREDLMRILLRRVEECNIPIRYDARAVTIECGGVGRRVLFANGDAISTDIVIGADGRMNSVARMQVTGCNRPVFQGFVNWIGIHKWDVPAFDQMEICDYWGVGARFGIVPVSANMAYWAGGIAVTDDDRDDASEQIADLRKAFDRWPSPIGEIVSNMSDTNTKRLVLYDHDPVPVWHKDNVLLIGDAAHAALPTSGQGRASIGGRLVSGTRVCGVAG